MNLVSIRDMDTAGRIVLPMEMRKALGIGVGEPLVVTADLKGQTIMLRRYDPIATGLLSIDRLKAAVAKLPAHKQAACFDAVQFVQDVLEIAQ